MTKILATTILALAVIALFGANSAYAGEVKFPTGISDDYMTGQTVQVNYKSDNRYDIVITLQYQVPDEKQVPKFIYFPTMTGDIIRIPAQDDFITANTPVLKQPTIAEIIVEAEEYQKKFDEREQEREEQAEEIWGDYRQCLIEFAEEQPVRFAAWERTASLKEFTIPDAASFIKQHDQIQLKADLAWQACETLKKYKWIGIAEANKIIDGHPLGLPLDTTDSPYTVDITQEALDEAERIALAFACSPTGTSMGLCREDSTAVNRGEVEQARIFATIASNPSYKAMIEYLNAHPDIDEETLLIAGTNTACQIAWSSSALGETSQMWWADRLLDGTCDDYIPNLKEVREK